MAWQGKERPRAREAVYAWEPQEDWKAEVVGDPNLRLDLMQYGGDRPRDAQGLGRADSGCRAVDQAESPVSQAGSPPP